MRVWTEAYSPFIMGGDVRAPIGAEVEAGEPINLGGVSVCVVHSPAGRTFIAEASTGAFVGTSLGMVKKDLSAADPTVIKKQLKDAAERAKKVRWLDTDKFWARFV